MKKDKDRRRVCIECGSKHTERVGWLVENDYPGVTRVDEKYEHTFEKPGQVRTCMNFKQWRKLAIWLSLFFTPIAGPFMALAIKILYDGKIDKEMSAQVQKEWARQGFCFRCGVTWEECI
jgi:hypothetical protein